MLLLSKGMSLIQLQINEINSRLRKEIYRLSNIYLKVYLKN